MQPVLKQPAPLIGAVIVLLFGNVAAGSGSAFTYQGQLKRGGVPVNEVVDFKFFLLDEFVLPIGPEIQMDGIDVVGGLFTVELDFGQGWFNGENRFVEIWVRLPAGGGLFKLLSPPQPVRPAPYAMFALDGNEGPPGPQGDQGDPGDPGPPGDSHWQVAGTSTFYVDGNVGVGTVDPLAPHHVSDTNLSLTPGVLEGDDLLIESTDAVLGLYSNDGGGIGSGIALKEISAGAVVDTWGILRETSDAGSGLRLTYGPSHQHFANPARMFLDANGGVGIGTTAPDQRLDVYGNMLLGENDISSFLHFGGGYGVVMSDANVMIVSDANDTSGPAPGGDIIFGAGSEVDTELNRGFTVEEAFPLGEPRNEHMRITGTGNVGIGTAVPVTPLQIDRDEELTGSDDFISGGHFTLSSPNTIFNMVLDGNEIQTRHGNDASDPQNAVFLNDRGGNVHLARNGRVAIGTTMPAARLHVQADADIAPTALLVAGVPGDDSVILPVNSIGPDELLSEPGVASDYEVSVSLFDAETVTVNSSTINCPADGFVVAIATAEFKGPGPLGTSDRIILGITTSLGSIPTDQRRFVDLEDLDQLDTVTIHEVIPVSAGSTTIRFRVQDGQSVAENPRLTLMYFSSSYGTVEIP